MPDQRGARPRYTMRLGRHERQVIEAAAAQRELPTSTYIRRVALERARRELASPPGGGEGEA